ncbi:MAG: formylglycine-generating enzyme family protein [Proteobacteria bacterium]|nr:formylglycine-generating enzyme family protein [Pseudomonadota bacterium]
MKKSKNKIEFAQGQRSDQESEHGTSLLSKESLSQSKIVKLKTFKFSFQKLSNQGKVEKKKDGTAYSFIESIRGSTDLEMVFIPSGDFTMGYINSDQNLLSLNREISIIPFFLGKHQVTQSQWRAVASLPKVSCNLDLDPSYLKGDNRPVEKISWHEAIEFCQRLSLYSSRQYRLPSEAEWEYACRAGTKTMFSCGEVLNQSVANYSDEKNYINSGKGGFADKTTNVMSFPPNAFGLYDMHGNVREWCFDHWHDNYQGAPLDNSAWVTGGRDSLKVLRGGSYISKMQDCCSMSRQKDLAIKKNHLNGFRVALSLPLDEEAQ